MDYTKLTPRLSIAHDLLDRRGLPGLRRSARLLNFTSIDDTPKPARVVVFLHCPEDADLSHLTELGIEVNQQAGAVRTGIVPLASLDALSEDSTVRRVTSTHYLRPLMDVAPAAVGLPDFQQAFPGLTGKDVVVGAVDSGIDPKHPDFTDRIDRIWDQTLPGPGVPEGGYGVELTGATAILTSRDTIGHGTHVAGIAAGAGDRFRGVAPAARLVVVKTDWSDAHIADGVRYIFRVADDLGLPAVVNLSLGGHFDAHDGSDSLSLVIDAASEAGRIVCCSAGNEGNDNIHARLTVAQGRTASVACSVPAASVSAAGAFLLNGWYPGGDRLEVAVAGPSGIRTDFQPILTDASPVGVYDLPDGQVQIATPGADPDNGDHHFLALVELAASPSTTATERPWRLLARGEATDGGDSQVDVWILDQTEGLGASFSGRAVTDSMKVGSPGTAGSAITVASYTTRVEWDSLSGEHVGVGLDLDTISDFSSEGPLRNGAEKPDVTAPGAMIASCLSADSPRSPDSQLDDLHVLKGGTSMAAPLVSGIIALLLQQEPNLTPAAAKQLLQDHSAIPDRDQGTFDPKWGFGLINVAEMRP